MDVVENDTRVGMETCFRKAVRAQRAQMYDDREGFMMPEMS